MGGLGGGFGDFFLVWGEVLVWAGDREIGGGQFVLISE